MGKTDGHLTANHVEFISINMDTMPFLLGTMGLAHCIVCQCLVPFYYHLSSMQIDQSPPDLWDPVVQHSRGISFNTVFSLLKDLIFNFIQDESISGLWKKMNLLVCGFGKFQSFYFLISIKILLIIFDLLIIQFRNITGLLLVDYKCNYDLLIIYHKNCEIVKSLKIIK